MSAREWLLVGIPFICFHAAAFVGLLGNNLEIIGVRYIEHRARFHLASSQGRSPKPELAKLVSSSLELSASHRAKFLNSLYYQFSCDQLFREYLINHQVSLAFVNSPRRESGYRGVLSLLPTVTTTFFVGVPVKRQQPTNVIIEMLHICFSGLTFQSAVVSIQSTFTVNSNCMV